MTTGSKSNSLKFNTEAYDKTRSNLNTKFIIHQFISPTDSNYKSLFHYTSVGVMDSILKNGEFWASNIYYQNDAMEYYEGVTCLENIFSEQPIIRTFLKGIKKENGFSSEGIFTISFSGESDNLHQWITYARESGICIELDGKMIKNTSLFYHTTDDHIEAYCDSKSLIKKVKYTSKNKDTPQEILERIFSTTFQLKKDKSLNGIYVDKAKSKYTSPDNYNDPGINDAVNGYEIPNFNNNVDENLINILNNYQIDTIEYLKTYASYCKNSYFYDENEYRAVIYPVFAKSSNNERFETPKIDYLVKDNGIIRPYMKVFFNKNNEDGTQNYKSELVELPIKSITVGPSGNQQSVFDSVVHRVKYGKKKVYNYYEKDHNAFNENFEIFFWESLKRALEETSRHIRCFDIENLHKKLSKELEKEIEDTPGIKKWKKPKIQINPEIIKNHGLINYVIDEDSCSSLISTDDLIAHIKRNNYFTKEGIWIKKSKIPYIF